MGTSGSFGGQAGRTPLVPTWLDPDGGGAPPADDGDAAPPGVPTAPAERAPITSGQGDRFRGPRSNFTRFAGSGGRDRASLGRAVSSYVSDSLRGSRNAARRMGGAITAGAGLVGFLQDVRSQGGREALRAINLAGFAGRPVEEIFGALADQLCPAGGPLDEAIARDAFMETIVELANEGVTSLDNLTQDQIQTVFELYATHAIEARLCNDIGHNTIALPNDARAAAQVHDQLGEFIRRGVSDALSRSHALDRPVPRDHLTHVVSQVYEEAFEILRALGETEAR